MNKNKELSKKERVITYSIFNKSWTDNLIKMYEEEEKERDKILKKDETGLDKEKNIIKYAENRIKNNRILFLDGYVNSILRNKIMGKSLLIPNSRNTKKELQGLYNELNEPKDSYMQKTNKETDKSEGLESRLLDYIIRGFSIIISVPFIETDRYFTKISFNINSPVIDYEPIIINLKYHPTKYSKEYLLDYIGSIENKVTNSLIRAEKDNTKVNVGLIYNKNIDEYEAGYLRIEEEIPRFLEIIVKKYVFETGITGNKKNFTERKKSKQKSKQKEKTIGEKLF